MSFYCRYHARVRMDVKPARVVVLFPVCGACFYFVRASFSVHKKPNNKGGTTNEIKTKDIKGHRPLPRKLFLGLFISFSHQENRREICARE